MHPSSGNNLKSLGLVAYHWHRRVGGGAELEAMEEGPPAGDR